MSVDEVFRKALSRAGVIRVRSVLNPFLWCFAWSVIFVLAAYAFKDDAPGRYVFIGAAVLPLPVALCMGVFFAIRQPNRLQSEEFIIRQQELTIIEKKGDFSLPAPQSENDQAATNDPDHDVTKGRL